MIDEDRQELIATRLSQRNAMQACQRCLSEHFEILAEAEIPLIANNLSRMSESFANPLPVVLITCKNCGYMFQHVRGLLGLPE
jgi:predicted nucleic-acid-binding Zn-ribbon protein